MGDEAAATFKNWATGGSPCGCYAINVAQPVNFCLLHAAAPALAAITQKALDVLASIDSVNTDGLQAEIRAVLASTEQPK